MPLNYRCYRFLRLCQESSTALLGFDESGKIALAAGFLQNN
jgi:hypothetical protein